MAPLPEPKLEETFCLYEVPPTHLQRETGNTQTRSGIEQGRVLSGAAKLI
jgi:hypothetical protein